MKIILSSRILNESEEQKKKWRRVYKNSAKGIGHDIGNELQDSVLLPEVMTENFDYV